MTPPSELQLHANAWRNIAGAALDETKRLVTSGVTGFSVELGYAVANHATMIATILEERAAHLESMKVTT